MTPVQDNQENSYIFYEVFVVYEGPIRDDRCTDADIPTGYLLLSATYHDFTGQRAFLGQPNFLESLICIFIRKP
jgi:hypothetical protein